MKTILVERWYAHTFSVSCRWILSRLAKESLEADLPEGWEMEIMEEGEHAGTPYYFNEELGESMWEHPKDDFYRAKYLELKSKREKRRGSGVIKEDDSKSFNRAQRNDDVLTADDENENRRVNIPQVSSIQARYFLVFAST